MKQRLVIIGGGPGGYVAAIRAAQLGAEVHLVESGQLGGTCLNVGCIPTKALLHTAELYRTVKKGSLIGLKADNVYVDWKALMARKWAVVSRLVKGVEGLLAANGVTVHRGRGYLQDANTVVVEGEGATALRADKIILAVGSTPVQLKFPGHDLPGVIDSTGALDLPQVPASMLIVGGGVIGIEFAALYSSLGTKVTVVELLPEILPAVDTTLTAKLKPELSRQGVTFLTETRLKEVVAGKKGLVARVEHGGNCREIEAEYILVAVGRRPFTDNIGLAEAGVLTDRGRIVVDEHFVTSVPHIYAIGDCNGQVMLAHAASAQGIAAVEHALGHKPNYNRNVIPSCIYTSPELASVGFTEQQVKDMGIAYKCGLFPLSANGKAVIEAGGAGIIKILATADTGKILGIHILGPRATDIIAAAALAIQLGASAADIAGTIYAHPTVGEAMAEAALAVYGLSLHWPPGMKIR